MRPSIVWQFRFLRGFLGGHAAKTPPFTMLVDVTQRCNLNCLHCRCHSPQGPAGQQAQAGVDFPLDRFLALCREARDWGIRKVVLIGEGEPLLHPGLLEMVAAARAAGCRVLLLTNGTILQAHHAEEFMRVGLNELRVSLWASDEEEYRSLYPGSNPAMFNRAVQGVQSLAAARQPRRSTVPRIIMHRPIEPRFFRRLEGTLDLARKMGCDAVSFSLLKPLLRQDMDRLLAPDEERELAKILADIGKKAQAAGLAHNTAEVLQRLRIGRAVWERLPCYIGWIDVRIRVNGDVVPCDTCQWVMGNIHRDGIREIWNGPDFREFRRISRSRDGIMRSGRNCCCDFCCHVGANARLHRLLRWFSPAAAALRETLS